MNGLLILPSPFLGPVAYAGLAESLHRLGVRARVASHDGPVHAGTLVERWAEQATGDEDLVLVAHSNAGYLAPLVGRAAGAGGVVFVDAALPPQRGPSNLAPPAFRRHLRELADDAGLLPPWTRWWSREDLAEVLPDPWWEWLDPQLPRVPLGYVETEVEVPAGWEQTRCAYLALGPTAYGAELARARAAGWPVRVVPGAQHLHPLVHPEETARAVLELADLLG